MFSYIFLDPKKTGLDAVHIGPLFKTKDQAQAALDVAVDKFIHSRLPILSLQPRLRRDRIDRMVVEFDDRFTYEEGERQIVPKP